MKFQIISIETFAHEERRLGKKIHLHKGVWWEQSSPFYCKPINEFSSFVPKSSTPNLLKALFGYSHQVPDSSKATRFVSWNILDGENLINFSLDCLKPSKRRTIRKGLQQCMIKYLLPTENNIEQMRQINISQAKKFEGTRESGTFLSSEYYDLKATEWREQTRRLFTHLGNYFVGAYVGHTLVAYINLIQIEDTLKIGAVKSCSEYLQHRPVDALYFTVLSMAAKSRVFTRIVNGGPDGEPESLTYFKGEFHIIPISFPYYTWSVLPMTQLRKLKSMVVLESLK